MCVCVCPEWLPLCSQPWDRPRSCHARRKRSGGEDPEHPPLPTPRPLRQGRRQQAPLMEQVHPAPASSSPFPYRFPVYRTQCKNELFFAPFIRTNLKNNDVYSHLFFYFYSNSTRTLQCSANFLSICQEKCECHLRFETAGT